MARRGTLVAARLALGATLAFCFTLLGADVPSAEADGPSTSFSVDLEPGTPGIQSTRVLPLGLTFSVAVVLDNAPADGVLAAVTKLHYDDVHLTAPATGLPADWAPAPVPETLGGMVVPLPGAPSCLPAPGSAALTLEDDVGLATIETSCGTKPDPAAGYTGPIMQFVLRCDAAGSAPVSIDHLGTFILDSAFILFRDHVHNAMVTCGAPTGDADGDGMPDAYENDRTCLDSGVADGGGDPDGDGLTSIDELTRGTEPCASDTDGDGCADSEELGQTPLVGGLRSPLNQWDFYDVNGSEKVDAIDTGLVRSRFNVPGPTPPTDVPFDRSYGTESWAPDGPDGVIGAIDIALVRAAFGHDCRPSP